MKLITSLALYESVWKQLCHLPLAFSLALHHLLLHLDCFLCLQLHLLMSSQPVHKGPLWKVPVVAFEDFLSWRCGSKEQKHTQSNCAGSVTTCDISYTQL